MVTNDTSCNGGLFWFEGHLKRPITPYRVLDPIVGAIPYRQLVRIPFSEWTKALVMTPPSLVFAYVQHDSAIAVRANMFRGLDIVIFTGYLMQRSIWPVHKSGSLPIDWAQIAPEVCNRLGNFNVPQPNRRAGSHRHCYLASVDSEQR